MPVWLFLAATGARNVDCLLNQQILPVVSQQLLSHLAAGLQPCYLALDWDEEEGISLIFKAGENAPGVREGNE